MKRGLTLFLVLLAVCFALPAPAAAAEKAVDADLLRDYLQEQFGVTILMGKECSGWSPEEYEFRIIPEGNTPFQRLVIGNRRFTGLLLILFNVLNAFPASFFRGFVSGKYPEGLQFRLADEISARGIPFGGVQTSGDGSLDIMLSRTGVAESSVHHEIWHAMELQILEDDRHAFDKWRNLNPKGFRYSQQDSVLAAGGQYDEPEDWFAREYSTTFEYEDRATTFEAMMTKSADWWSTRPNLQKKAQFLLEKTKPVFGEIFGQDSESFR